MTRPRPQMGDIVFLKSNWLALLFAPIFLDEEGITPVSRWNTEHSGILDWKAVLQFLSGHVEGGCEFVEKALMKPPGKMLEARRQFYEAIDANSMSLGETPKAMRRLIGKSQKQFSEVFDVALPAIRAIEQGRGNPTLATVQKIAKPFGLDVGFRRKG